MEKINLQEQLKNAIETIADETKNKVDCSFNTVCFQRKKSKDNNETSYIYPAYRTKLNVKDNMAALTSILENAYASVIGKECIEYHPTNTKEVIDFVKIDNYPTVQQMMTNIEDAEDERDKALLRKTRYLALTYSSDKISIKVICKGTPFLDASKHFNFLAYKDQTIEGDMERIQQDIFRIPLSPIAIAYDDILIMNDESAKDLVDIDGYLKTKAIEKLQFLLSSNLLSSDSYTRVSADVVLKKRNHKLFVDFSPTLVSSIINESSINKNRMTNELKFVFSNNQIVLEDNKAVSNFINFICTKIFKEYLTDIPVVGQITGTPEI